ncbi:MAG: riboflavin synthase [Gemmatimonadota bacterium]|nr:riboflavin synthase [Gemmatimonadota bacterium]
MFTGIVESTGTVRAVEALEKGRRLEVATPWEEPLEVGESVAVDGCCLTAVDVEEGAFVAEAVRETVKRTAIGDYEIGRVVNLERSLAVGDRLGGHFVLGHVDAVATVRSIERRGENRYIELSLPASGRPLVAAQGSIAVDGVSLTVLDLTGEGARLSIVPHTWEATNLSDRAPGDGVNVEYDVIARYLKRFMEFRE